LELGIHFFYRPILEMEVIEKMRNERRVSLYGRVSTSQKQSPEMQMRELREYCRNRGWKVSGEFVDSGVSGSKDSRPQLDRLMADAHRRRFDIVAVWKFDRFARSVSHLLRALETFRSLAIEFVSLSEQVDTSTPAYKIVTDRHRQSRDTCFQTASHSP